MQDVRLQRLLKEHKSNLRIGIDLMGGDRSPLVLFEAVLKATDTFKEAQFVVLATPSIIETIKTSIDLAHNLSSSIQFHPTADSIEMNDSPLAAIRQKKNSSLVVGMRLLKKRQLDAFVSAGNTGALIASATLFLPLLPGIKRPALLASLPTQQGYVVVIDVGGNVSCKAHHLVQFAQMGAAYQRCAKGITAPRVGLLNIGVESQKGTDAIRQAYQILKDKEQESFPANMHFVGNIEGREVFQGIVDVLVTDGFTGNVLLKTSEGASSYILSYLEQALKKASNLDFKSIFNHLHQHFDYEEYPGAIICGIDAVVVKCHGHSSSIGMFNAIKGSVSLVQNHFISQIKSQLELFNIS